MPHLCPSDEVFIPNATEYKGFRLAEPIDSRARGPHAIETTGLRLVYPESLVLNTQRRELARNGIMLGIGITALFERYPVTIPEQCFALIDDEPVKIMTSTLLLSEYDGRYYIAYFYFDQHTLVRSFIAQKPWASKCPSLIIV